MLCLGVKRLFDGYGLYMCLYDIPARMDFMMHCVALVHGRFWTMYKYLFLCFQPWRSFVGPSMIGSWLDLYALYCAKLKRRSHHVLGDGFSLWFERA
jgi:hypothetical protein